MFGEIEVSVREAGTSEYVLIMTEEVQKSLKHEC